MSLPTRNSAVLGVKPCGCITFVDLLPPDMEAAKDTASRYGRTAELVPYDEALRRWRNQDTFDCTVCGITD